MKKWLLLALFIAAGAQALPEGLRHEPATWRQWGSGEMSWFGFSLYRATLWVAGSEPGADPTALELDYRP